MTEQEWLTSTDPQAMLMWLQGTEHLSERKARLLASACVRRVWHLLDDENLRHAVELSESYADDLVDETGLRRDWYPHCAELMLHGAPVEPDTKAAWYAACDAASPRPLSLKTYWLVKTIAGAIAWHLIGHARNSSEAAAWAKRWNAAEAAELEKLAPIVRCVFGNPFRPVAPIGAAVTPSLTAVAQEIYETRSFERTPKLADALQSVGCHDWELLGHLCDAGPHARGCWAVDLLLGKA